MTDNRSESYVASAHRAQAARDGYMLFRNNSGSLHRTEPVRITAAHVGQVLHVATGRPVRFGLGNDSAAVNERIKSSDLIGWRPVLVTAGHVGTIIAQFVAHETKPEGWKLLPSDARGHAQARFGGLVTADGGEFQFVTGV